MSKTTTADNSHKCNTCSKQFPTCDAVKLVWGIDRNPQARGVVADTVLECDAYSRVQAETAGNPDVANEKVT